MTTTKPPVAKIKKAYKAADELLALWPSIRPYYDATQEEAVRFHTAGSVDDEVQSVFGIFRGLRHEIEDDTLSHVTVIDTAPS